VSRIVKIKISFFNSFRFTCAYCIKFAPEKLQVPYMRGQFTKLVKAGNRLREFNFRKLPAPTGKSFHVDVSDERGSRFIFKMHKEQEDHWKIDNENLPNWIYEAEQQLADAIDNE
jgi:hypothetical protein